MAMFVAAAVTGECDGVFGRGVPERIGSVLGGGSGPTVGVNYGTVAGTILAGNATGLADVVLDPSLIPLELGLTVGDEPVGGFTGRGWLVEKIDELIAKVADRRVGGYVLVEAEAGLGKSALATYLAFSPTRRWPAHFSRQSISPEAARANLAAQITYAYPLTDSVDGSAGLPGNYTDPAWFAQQLMTIQARRRARGEMSPLVVLIDGLDEAPAPSAGEVAFGLPRMLPPGVVVVATTRPGHPLPAEARVERIDVTGQANLDDLREYITFRARSDRVLAARLAVGNVAPEAFTRGLLAAAGGVWIYALSVIDQVCDGDLPVDRLDALPAGLAGYYSENLRRIRERDPGRWDAVVLPVLGTLAAVTELLTSAALADWAGDLPLGQVQDVLDGPLRPFLAHTRGDPGAEDPTGWYRLRHQSLRDFLTGRETSHQDDTVVQLSARCAQATRQAHRRILARLTPAADEAGVRRWEDAGSYAAHHLTNHAAAAGELDRLALDPGYLLWIALPPLLRIRKIVTDPQARQAIAARELTGDISALTADEQLRWLHVWAVKCRSTALAAACAAQLPPGAPRADRAIWRGVAHTELHGHTGEINAVGTWSRPDGTTLLVTAGDDNVVRLWDPDTLQPAGELHSHTGEINAVGTWSRPDGTTLLVTAGGDNVVRLWDPDTLQPAGELHSHTSGLGRGIRAVGTWSRPDGTTLLVTAGDDNVVRLWDPDTLQPAGELYGHTSGLLGGIRAVGTWMRPDGTTLLVTAGGDRVVRLWDPDTLQPAGELHSHTGGINAVGTWSRDGITLLVTAGDDNVVRLWDPDTLQPAGELHGHTSGLLGGIRAVGTWMRPDGITLLVTAGGDRVVRLWDPGTLQPAGELHGHTSGGWGGIGAVGTWMRPDGTTLLVTAGDDNVVRLWDPDTLQPAGELHSHTGEINAVGTWSRPDGTTLLVTAGGDNVVRLWDPDTLQPAGELHSHTSGINAVGTWSRPDGTTLLVTAGDDNVVRLWDPDTLQPAGELHGHTSGLGRGIRAVGTWMRPDGTTLLVTAGDDNVVRLWDPDTLQPAGELHSHTGGINAVGTWMRPDGTTLLVTAGEDRVVRLWDPDTLQPAGELHGHTSGGWRGIRAVGTWMRPDGITLLVTAGGDNVVRLWDPDTLQPAGELHGHTSGLLGGIRAVGTWMRPDGTTLLVTAGDDNVVRLWDPDTLQPAGELHGHTSGINAVGTWSRPDGTTLLVTAGDDACVLTWKTTCNER
ncbi:hypothetical protein O7598_27600 [Micromonospora sp. WMMC241]|uniref:hypothetical protein n=1 Tax=Micromonospora sp. WMMC241 TaxID=3015159 RepID=UPI0022B60FDE|nr:hypothetical protein [Micromonospora sp. WMMC241]MCZ7440196.1 hypothetical protein [Micromonospora sp. WMMC241]